MASTALYDDAADEEVPMRKSILVAATGVALFGSAPLAASKLSHNARSAGRADTLRRKRMQSYRSPQDHPEPPPR